MYDILELNTKLLMELREIAKSMGIKRVEALKKQDLIFRILDQQAIKTVVTGVPPHPRKVKVPAYFVKEEPKIPVIEQTSSAATSELVQPVAEPVTVIEPLSDLPRRRGRPAGWKRVQSVVDEALLLLMKLPEEKMFPFPKN